MCLESKYTLSIFISSSVRDLRRFTFQRTLCRYLINLQYNRRSSFFNIVTSRVKLKLCRKFYKQQKILVTIKPKNQLNDIIKRLKEDWRQNQRVSIVRTIVLDYCRYILRRLHFFSLSRSRDILLQTRCRGLSIYNFYWQPRRFDAVALPTDAYINLLDIYSRLIGLCGLVQ